MEKLRVTSNACLETLSLVSIKNDTFSRLSLCLIICVEMQRNCNLWNFIFLNSEINCQSIGCKLNVPQSEVTQQNTLDLSKKLLFSDTNWLEQNFIHVEKSTTEHCQNLVCTCNFY